MRPIFILLASLLPLSAYAVPAPTTTTLPNAIVGAPYSQQLTATGNGTLTWSVSGGTLPAGMTLSADGKLTGTPIMLGDFSINGSVADADGATSFVVPVKVVTGAANSNTLPPLRLTTVQPNGTTQTAEISGSFAYQVFQGLLVPSTMALDGSVTRKQFLAFQDKQGNAFTLGPNGEVYRNALRLYTTSSTGALTKMTAAKLVSFGNEVYALGKSSNVWYRWDGTATVNKWVTLPVDFDTSILN